MDLSAYAEIADGEAADLPALAAGRTSFERTQIPGGIEMALVPENFGEII